jgi:hypothetical protein
MLLSSKPLLSISYPFPNDGNLVFSLVFEGFLSGFQELTGT